MRWEPLPVARGAWALLLGGFAWGRASGSSLPSPTLLVELIAVVDGGMAAMDESTFRAELSQMTQVPVGSIAVSGGTGGLVTATLGTNDTMGPNVTNALRSATMSRLRQAYGADFMGGDRPLVRSFDPGEDSSPPPACQTLFAFVGSGPFGAGSSGYMMVGLIVGSCVILWCLATALLIRSCCPAAEGAENGLLAMGGNGMSSKKDFFHKSAASSASSIKSKPSGRSEYTGHQLHEAVGCGTSGPPTSLRMAEATAAI